MKVDGLPFWLEADTVLLGNEANFGLIRQDRLFGVSSTLKEDQSETSDTIRASSESMHCLK